MSNGQFTEGNKAAQGHGRPKGSGYNQECRRWASEIGFKKLIEIAEGRHTKYAKIAGRVHTVGFTEDQQLDAIKTVIAYGHGKPPASIDITSGGDTFFDFLRKQFPNGSARRGTGAGGNGR